MGRMSEKASKNGDCKNALGKRKLISSSILDMKDFEKIGLKKGSIEISREIAKPVTRVFQGYLLVCSIYEMFV